MSYNQTGKLMGSIFSRLCIAAALTMLSPASFAQFTVPVGATTDVPIGGSMDLGCTSLNVQGTFNVNSGEVSDIGGVSIAPSGTVNGGQGTLNVSGDWANLGSFVPGTGTVIFADGCAGGPIELSGATVFNNLTLTSTVGRTFVIPAGANIIVNGILTLLGAPGLPIQLVSSAIQTAVIGLGPSALVVQNFANVAGNVQLGATSAVQAIPTMSQYGLLVLSLLIAGTALWGGRIGAFNALRKN